MTGVQTCALPISRPLIIAGGGVHSSRATGELAYLEAWRGAAPGAPAYRAFVEHWTTPDFARYVDDLGLQVDSAGADEEAFLAVCALEREFWEMAWTSART